MSLPIKLNSANEHSDAVVCKVLIYEHDKSVLEKLKQVFETAGIIGYRVTKDRIFRVLNNIVDLGAIFMPEFDSRGNSNLELAINIHKARPELPIFFRREETTNLSDLPMDIQKMMSGVYVHGHYEDMQELLDSFIFTRHYPSDFVNQIRELSMDAFTATFKDMHINCGPAYIVKDKIIYGELFSLMPLESHWCRGYMMLQTEEKAVMDVITTQKTHINPIEPNFRHVNAVLGELSNMIWGAFKNRYGIKPGENYSRVRVEVPIIVNHGRRFISFGSDDPQLCFKYTLTDESGATPAVTVFQKFVFSLDWSPEKYSESVKNMDELVNNGELELF